MPCARLCPACRLTWKVDNYGSRMLAANRRAHGQLLSPGRKPGILNLSGAHEDWIERKTRFELATPSLARSPRLCELLSKLILVPGACKLQAIRGSRA